LRSVGRVPPLHRGATTRNQLQNQNHESHEQQQMYQVTANATDEA
jgi:hypothetical protein